MHNYITIFRCFSKVLRYRLVYCNQIENSNHKIVTDFSGREKQEVEFHLLKLI